MGWLGWLGEGLEVDGCGVAGVRQRVGSGVVGSGERTNIICFVYRNLCMRVNACVCVWAIERQSDRAIERDLER